MNWSKWTCTKCGEVELFRSLSPNLCSDCQLRLSKVRVIAIFKLVKGIYAQTQAVGSTSQVE